MNRLAVVYTRATVGIDAPLVTVEVHITQGMPNFSIVGLPEMAVKESRDRIRSALISNHFELPSRRLTVNLAPADLPKEGGRFDLPIALGILLASEQIRIPNIEHYEFAGELGLTGELRKIFGALPIAIATQKAGRTLIFPESNLAEIALTRHPHYASGHLREVCDKLQHPETFKQTQHLATPCTEASFPIDWSDIKGQTTAKRALVIAAAGGHHLLLKGPPGTGKTMLAERLNTLLPMPTEQEQLEIGCLRSLYSPQTFNPWQRPFRSPHHSASTPALVGGGNPPKPGEISLAHHGVLFLDELPEFQRHVLEALRQPLESGQVTISRAKQQLTFPARFQLVAAMNPCPCGYAGDKDYPCRCTPQQMMRYKNKLSGPLLDRIDLHVDVLRLAYHDLRESPVSTETSSDIRKKITRIHQRQYERQGYLNARLSSKAIDHHCQLDASDEAFFIDLCEKLKLSMRAANKILKISRTLADLDHEEKLQQKHLVEAFSFREY